MAEKAAPAEEQPSVGQAAENLLHQVQQVVVDEAATAVRDVLDVPHRIAGEVEQLAQGVVGVGQAAARQGQDLAAEGAKHVQNGDAGGVLQGVGEMIAGHAENLAGSMVAAAAGVDEAIGHAGGAALQGAEGLVDRAQVALGGTGENLAIKDEPAGVQTAQVQPTDGPKPPTDGTAPSQPQEPVVPPVQPAASPPEPVITGGRHVEEPVQQPADQAKPPVETPVASPPPETTVSVSFDKDGSMVVTSDSVHTEGMESVNKDGTVDVKVVETREHVSEVFRPDGTVDFKVDESQTVTAASGDGEGGTFLDVRVTDTHETGTQDQQGNLSGQTQQQTRESFEAYSATGELTDTASSSSSASDHWGGAATGGGGSMTPQDDNPDG